MGLKDHLAKKYRYIDCSQTVFGFIKNGEAIHICAFFKGMAYRYSIASRSWYFVGTEEAERQIGRFIPEKGD